MSCTACFIYPVVMVVSKHRYKGFTLPVAGHYCFRCLHKVKNKARIRWTTTKVINGPAAP